MLRLGFSCCWLSWIMEFVTTEFRPPLIHRVEKPKEIGNTHDWNTLSKWILWTQKLSHDCSHEV
jgi:hypothetical protein